jgi:hypothetical protein
VFSKKKNVPDAALYNVGNIVCPHSSALGLGPCADQYEETRVVLRCVKTYMLTEKEKQDTNEMFDAIIRMYISRSTPTMSPRTLEYRAIIPL